jgi:hypothetical protein
MGLRSRLARWLSGTATPLPLTSSDAAQVQHLELEHAKLLGRVEKLELDRPAFVVALEELAERCHDILDSAESKRARIAAKQSKLDKQYAERDQGVVEQPLETLPDRDAVKAEVRRRMRTNGHAV